MSRDCSCEKCVHACELTPGKFLPGEAEKAADYLGVPFEQFKDRLILNYLRREIEDPHFWEPRKVDIFPNEKVASQAYTNAYGKCTFLTEDNKCEIHPFKPYECRVALVCEQKFFEGIEFLSNKWKEHEDKK